MKIDSTPGEDLAPLPFSPYLYSEFTSATETAARTMYTAEQMRAYALAERERCATLCEQLCVSDYDDYGNSVCAAAIRKG